MRVWFLALSSAFLVFSELAGVSSPVAPSLSVRYPAVAKSAISLSGQ